ncbi:MAG: ion transporter [Cyclobacteriaceae bacterium]
MAVSYHRKVLREFLEHHKVQRFIISLIVINAITIGFETNHKLMEKSGDIFNQFDFAILVIFILEILLKIYAYGLRFFTNAWNVFDFLIVAIAAMPAAGVFSVFRTLRILRTLRLLKNVPKLRIIIESLIKAVPSIGWIILLLAIIFYIFAVVGTNIYGDVFPQWFGTMGESIFTLFQIMTLESWSSGIARPILEEMPYAWIFFVPFILIATYTTLNIFIAIVVNTMNELHMAEIKDEEEKLKLIEEEKHRHLLAQISALQSKLERIEGKLDAKDEVN